MNTVRHKWEEGTPGDYIDRSRISRSANIARDIAQHPHLRHRLGGTEYIITNRPHELLGLIQKQWQRMTHQALEKRARTSDSDTEKLVELSHQIAYMQNLKFTAQPWDEPDARVVVVSYEVGAKFPPACSAMYLAINMNEQAIRAITGQMPIPRLVVTYDSRN